VFKFQALSSYFSVFGVRVGKVLLEGMSACRLDQKERSSGGVQQGVIVVTDAKDRVLSTPDRLRSITLAYCIV
jgi:hypothetical protein